MILYALPSVLAIRIIIEIDRHSQRLVSKSWEEVGCYYRVGTCLKDNSSFIQRSAKQPTRVCSEICS